MDTNSWKWFKYDDIFIISSFKGPNLLNSNEGEIPYISASSSNNGINGYVDSPDFVDGGRITVARNGSVGTAFFQPFAFYPSPDDVRIYQLRNGRLTTAIAIFLCTIIEKERYRFTYGRKFGTKRMQESSIKLPADSAGNPNWKLIEKYVKKKLIPQLPLLARKVWQKNFVMQPLLSTKKSLNDRDWHDFRYDDIFDIKKGFYNRKPEDVGNGEIPFIGATDSNNGITSRCTRSIIEQTSKTGDDRNAPINEKIFKSNCITVSNNGSVGYAFYQPIEFTCTHDVNPLYIHKKWNRELNPYIAQFLCTIIEKEKFRWAYGRKWRPKRMPSSIIRLPVKHNTEVPDWDFMEDYIKSLPYSSIVGMKL